MEEKIASSFSDIVRRPRASSITSTASSGTGQDAGVADEQIEGPKLSDGKGDQCICPLGLRQISRKGGRAYSILTQLSRDLLGVGATRPIADYDISATLGQQPRCRGTDATGATSDERPLSLEIDHSARSTISQMMCSMQRCSSCARSVRTVGMQIQ